MWLASYMTHYQKLNHRKCADWTYYHFLDGELGSNHLSWQWVQSTFAHKPYFMNEENLTRYGRFTDPIYRGEYEQVEAKLFDPKR
jgi:deoxyribodipyrimidine photo-lyase